MFIWILHMLSFTSVPSWQSETRMRVRSAVRISLRCFCALVLFFDVSYFLFVFLPHASDVQGVGFLDETSSVQQLIAQ